MQFVGIPLKAVLEGWPTPLPFTPAPLPCTATLLPFPPKMTALLDLNLIVIEFHLSVLNNN
jgi:hypothetical protein